MGRDGTEGADGGRRGTERRPRSPRQEPEGTGGQRGPVSLWGGATRSPKAPLCLSPLRISVCPQQRAGVS